MEKPVTFKVNKQQVVGMLHLPDRKETPVPGVVFLHGFRGGKQEAHCIFVKMARALCGAGIAALRIDFRGSGDSEGDFSRMTVGGEIKDACAAVRLLRKRREVDPGRVGVLGLSIGGLVTAFVLGDDPDLKAAVLWGAVADTLGVVKMNSSSESDEQMDKMGFFDMDGWAVGRDFVDELVTLDPVAAISETRAAVLLLHGGEDETVPVVDTTAYEAALKQADRDVEKQIIAGAGHTFSSIPWETEVMARSLDWFHKHL